jgi:hypothetical protein
VIEFVKVFLEGMADGKWLSGLAIQWSRGRPAHCEGYRNNGYANDIKSLMALYQKEANELNEMKSKAAENKRFLLESYAQSLNFWDTSFREKEQEL